MTAIKCDCGHDSTPKGCAAGYATTAEGRTMCYACADDAQRETMRTADRITAYQSGSDITTWSGGKLGRIVTTGKRHPWSRERHYVSVRDVHGQWWHGTAADGMWASLRRCRP